MAKQPPKGKLPVGPKFKRVMGEYGKRTLHHGGSGEIVRDVKVATAIAASEQRKATRETRRKTRRSKGRHNRR